MFTEMKFGTSKIIISYQVLVLALNLISDIIIVYNEWMVMTLPLHVHMQ